MNEDRESPPRAGESAFFGKITASLSHEINNVLAIVGELSGLLGDFLYSADQGRPLDPEKLKEISENIDKHVDRGKKIVKRLNRFAHSAEDSETLFDPREVLDNLLDISLRLATLKKIQLARDLTDEPLSVTGSPFKLQQAVFACIELFLSPSSSTPSSTTSRKESAITVTLKGEGRWIAVDLTGPPADRGAEAEREYLAALMREQGGEMEFLPEEGKTRAVRLRFPKAPKT